MSHASRVTFHVVVSFAGARISWRIAMDVGPISRRDVLRALTLGTTTGSVLKIIPLHAAEHVHKIAKEDKAKSATGSYAPKFFTAHQYKTLQALCQMIIPPDEQSAVAIDAGSPEY